EHLLRRLGILRIEAGLQRAHHARVHRRRVDRVDPHAVARGLARGDLGHAARMERCVRLAECVACLPDLDQGLPPGPYSMMSCRRSPESGGDSMESEQVLVVGAGPAGLCVALALAARGMEVEVVERQRREALAMPAFDGREIALTHGSMRILRQLGVWDRIPL